MSSRFCVFPLQFRINLSISTEKSTEILTRIVLNLQIYLGRTDVLRLLNFLSFLSAKLYSFQHIGVSHLFSCNIPIIFHNSDVTVIEMFKKFTCFCVLLLTYKNIIFMLIFTLQPPKIHLLILELL